MPQRAKSRIIESYFAMRSRCVTLKVLKSAACSGIVTLLQRIFPLGEFMNFRKFFYLDSAHPGSIVCRAGRPGALDATRASLRRMLVASRCLAPQVLLALVLLLGSVGLLRAESGYQVINGTRVFTEIDHVGRVATFSNECGSQRLTQSQLQNGAIPSNIIPCTRQNKVRSGPSDDSSRRERDALRERVQRQKREQDEAECNKDKASFKGEVASHATTTREQYERANRILMALNVLEMSCKYEAIQAWVKESRPHIVENYRKLSRQLDEEVEAEKRKKSAPEAPPQKEQSEREYAEALHKELGRQQVANLGRTKWCASDAPGISSQKFCIDGPQRTGEDNFTFSLNMACTAPMGYSAAVERYDEFGNCIRMVLHFTEYDKTNQVTSDQRAPAPRVVDAIATPDQKTSWCYYERHTNAMCPKINMP